MTEDNTTPEIDIDNISNTKDIGTISTDELDDELGSGLSYEHLSSKSRREVRKQIKKFKTSF